MIMDAVNQVRQFWTGPQFWWRHGWGLAFLWLVLSFIGVFLRRISKSQITKKIHSFLHLIVDLATLFLTVGTIYRLYVDTDNYGDWRLWPLGKIVHVISGILVTPGIVLQHLGGASALYGGDGSMHRKFGIIISIWMRIMIVWGFTIAHQFQTGIYAGIIGLIELIIIFGINVKEGVKVVQKQNIKKRR